MDELGETQPEQPQVNVQAHQAARHAEPVCMQESKFQNALETNQHFANLNMLYGEKMGGHWTLYEDALEDFFNEQNQSDTDSKEEKKSTTTARTI